MAQTIQANALTDSSYEQRQDIHIRYRHAPIQASDKGYKHLGSQEESKGHGA